MTAVASGWRHQRQCRSRVGGKALLPSGASWAGIAIAGAALPANCWSLASLSFYTVRRFPSHLSPRDAGRRRVVTCVCVSGGVRRLVRWTISTSSVTPSTLPRYVHRTRTWVKEELSGHDARVGLCSWDSDQNIIWLKCSFLHLARPKENSRV